MAWEFFVPVPVLTMSYYSLNNYIQDSFGEKLYKLSLNGGMTCPNRDGTLGTGGCIFCSEGGSGEFSQSAKIPIDQQIELAKKRVSAKFNGNKYIAYFQAFTNTYAPVKYLKELFEPVIERDDIAVLSIATRPDCLQDGVLELIAELNQKKPVWIELGFQTSNEKTAEYIRRGYKNESFEEAVKNLNKIGVHIVAHIILGLPNETSEDMLKTVDYVAHSGVQGIKIQLLHILKNTELFKRFEQGTFEALSMEKYIALLGECIEHLPKSMVVHRITGDGPKSLLVAPLWSADKKKVLNTISFEFRKNNITQGAKFI